MDTLAHASGSVVSLAVSLKKVRDEICEVSGKYGEQFSTKRARSYCLMTQVTDLTSQVITVEAIFRVSCSKRRISLAEVKILFVQLRTVASHLLIMRSELPGFQA